MLPAYLFWALKVLLGLVLVGAFANQAINHQLPLSFKLILVQIGVVVGAVIHIGHYMLLRRTVGRLYEPTKLVTRAGLYRWVRHPMYLGDMIVAISLASALPAPYSWVCLACLGAIVLQSHVEDRLMMKKFGHQYDVWSRTTHRLLPFLW